MSQTYSRRGRSNTIGLVPEVSPWMGSAHPDTAEALKPKRCKCEQPIPAYDEDGGLYCFRCAKALR